ASAGPSSHELRRYLRERLPEHMVPSAFVVLDALPLTPNGKIDRQALPAPEQDPTGQEEVEALCTPVEEVIAGVWAEVLGLQRVGARANFFDLGGHSLLATRVVSRLSDLFGVAIPVRVLFEAPTVAELARWVEAAQGGGQSLGPEPIQAAAREG